MATKQVALLSEAVLAANEATEAETVRITAEMVKQCQHLTELGREFVMLISTDPDLLTANECGTQASRIGEKHKELAGAINKLVQIGSQPATPSWVEAYNKLYNADAPFQKRYKDWREDLAAERERQERADAYREQLHRERLQHERRLQGELV